MNPQLEKLLTIFRESVQPRMTGLPVYNNALNIEAVGFKCRAGRLSGVVITPWCMNLVVWPGGDDEWQDRDARKTIDIEFPSGSQECIISQVEDLDRYLCLPLFTTVSNFADQDTARQVAVEVLSRLYTDTVQPADPAMTESPGDSTGLRRTMTRRELLRGEIQ